ncbi:MAG: choice-of-anchor Q domain-containing protein [Phycisphaerae bacterium]
MNPVHTKHWAVGMLLSILLLGARSAGATEVSGIQSGTWTLSHSPYLLVGNVTVPPQATLIIEPGVVVRAMGHYRITVDHATLLAVGTTSSPILMTADDTQTGWRGLRMMSASDETVLSHCIVEHAHGSGPFPEAHGGALWIDTCSPTISKNLFRFNSTHNPTSLTGLGGAVGASQSSVKILYNTMIQNSADAGGAIVVRISGSPTICGNTIINNTAVASGGGIYLGAGTMPTLEHNIIIGNHSSTSLAGGGGVSSWTNYALFLTFPIIRNNVIAFNTTNGQGGGLYLRYDRAVVKNNVVALNEGAHGGGIYALNFPSSAPIVTSSILWGNTATNAGDAIYLEQVVESNISVTYSNIQGGWPGVGNIDADPLFGRMPDAGADGVWGTDDDDLGDLRLLEGSPSINRGDPNFVPVPGETDLDGHARVLCSAVDMGPYEFGIGDYTCDQSVDLADFAFWGMCFTGPATGALPPYAAGCEVFDFNLDGAVDVFDFAGFQRAMTPPD